MKIAGWAEQHSNPAGIRTGLPLDTPAEYCKQIFEQYGRVTGICLRWKH